MRQTLWMRLTTALFLGVAFCPTALAADRTTVAVLNFVNRNPGNGWDWLEKGLADMLITDLSASAKLQVVERERMQQLFDELELAQGLKMNGTAARRFGKMAKASHVLTGTFWVKEDDLTIQSHMTDVASGKLARLEEVSGGATQALDLEKKLALAIIKNLSVALTEKERARLLRLPSRSIDAVKTYYGGIHLLDRRRPIDALAAFRSAARADATYDEPRVQSGRAYAVLKEYGHAAVTWRAFLRDRIASPLETDVLYYLGRLCVDQLDRLDEAEICFRAMHLRSGMLRLRTTRLPGIRDLGSLPRTDYAWLLVAEVEEHRGKFGAAAAIYAELHKPFIANRPRSDVRYWPSKLLWERLEGCLKQSLVKTGRLPDMPCAMIMLDTKHPTYEDDFSTRKRFNDTYWIDRHRMTYYLAAKGPGGFSRLVVSGDAPRLVGVEIKPMLTTFDMQRVSYINPNMFRGSLLTGEPKRFKIPGTTYLLRVQLTRNEYRPLKRLKFEAQFKSVVEKKEE